MAYNLKYFWNCCRIPTISSPKFRLFCRPIHARMEMIVNITKVSGSHENEFAKAHLNIILLGLLILKNKMSHSCMGSGKDWFKWIKD